MSGFETPAKRIGPSARKGAGTWKAERISSVILIPFALWGLWVAANLSGGGYEAAIGWLRSPVNAVLLLAFLAATCWHMALGMRVVIEDYVHGFSGRMLLLLNTLFCLGLFVAAAAAIASAVLGAGNGAS